MLGSIVQAGSGLLGSVIGGIFGAQQQKREFQNAKELAALNNKYAEQAATTAYERQIEQWNRENEYNTPAAQRARFEEAGLNPSLMYGAGASAGNAGGLSTVPMNEYAAGGVYRNMPRRYDKLDTMSQLADIFNKTADFSLKLNQAKESAANAGVAGATLEYTRAMTTLTEMKTVGQGFTNAIERANAYVAESTASATIAERFANSRRAFAEFTIAAEKAAVAKDISEEERKQAIIETNRAQLGYVLDNLNVILAEANIHKTEAEIALKRQEIETECARLGLIESEISANEAQSALFGANARLADANATGVEIDNETRGEMNRREINGKKIENTMSVITGTAKALRDGVSSVIDVVAMCMTGGSSAVASSVLNSRQSKRFVRTLSDFSGEDINCVR